MNNVDLPIQTNSNRTVPDFIRLCLDEVRALQGKFAGAVTWVDGLKYVSVSADLQYDMLDEDHELYEESDRELDQWELSDIKLSPFELQVCFVHRDDGSECFVALSL